MQKLIELMAADYYPGDTAPGCAVMVLRRDEKYLAARGFANMETGERITADTNFRLASVSKQFTAACVLQLRDRGLLRLDQSLTDFFPDFADYGRAITLEHLLRHTSGIKDYEKLIPDGQLVPVTDSDIVAMLATQTAGDFAPGERFRYSNSGYAILAMIVEAVSGLGFPAYLREHIFTPAAMTGTLAYVNAPGLPEPAQRAIGYSLNANAEFIWADQNITTAVLGDGGIYCSAADYSRWIKSYWSGEIISEETVSQTWTPGQTNGGQVVPYGYGWRLEELGGRWRPYHPGSTSGFRNGAIIDNQKQWAVLVLSNRCNGDAVALAGEIARVLES